MLFSFVIVPISLRILWQSRDKRRKLTDAMGSHDILSFIGSYPLVPDLHLKANSVQQAIQRLEPVASIRVDTLRSIFKSEDEWQSVLCLMDDALKKRRKRKAREINN